MHQGYDRDYSASIEKKTPIAFPRMSLTGIVEIPNDWLSWTRWLSRHVSVVFGLWALWLSFATFAFGPLSWIRVHDIGDSNIPARLALLPAALAGQLGYWAPYLAAGTDRLASSFTNTAGSLVFLVLPGWLAYGLIMWLQRFVAGYFMFRLLRDVLSLDFGPALYGGMAYSLFAQASINAGWDGFTLYDGLVLPGLAGALWTFWRVKRCALLVVIGVALLVAVSSSFVMALFILPVLFFWFIFVMPESKPRFWILMAVFVLAWLIASLYSLWPSLANSPLSHRAAWVSNSPLSGGWRGSVSFASYLALDNVVPLALAVFGLVASRGRNRRLISLAGAVVACLGYVAVYPILHDTIYPYLGPLSGFQLDRIYLIVPFLAIVAGSVGVQIINGSWPPRPVRTGWATRAQIRAMLLVVAIAWLGLYSIWANGAKLKDIALGRNFAAFYQRFDLQKLAKTGMDTSHEVFRVATVADNSRPLHPAYAWAYGLESADGYLVMYPKRYQDFWEQVIYPLTSVDSTVYDYFHYWGSRIYLFSPTGGFPEDQEVQFEDYYNLKLLSLANVRYVISPRPLASASLVQLSSADEATRLDCTGLNKKLSTTARIQAALGGKCYRGGPLYIYENREVLPRFFLVHRVELFDNSSQLLSAMRNATLGDLRATAYAKNGLLKNIPRGALTLIGGAAEDVDLRSYGADRIVLEVKSDVGGILVATNSFSPYWKARIDNSPAEMFPVDHAFQGVYITAGQHEVVLEYMPPYRIG